MLRFVVAGALVFAPAHAATVRSKSGATAQVADRAASAFQCVIDRLEGQGYPVRFMGGYRSHGSVRGSLHPQGLALDINQVGRNRTQPAMPRNEIELAASCGVISGAQWAYGDSGHFQIGGWSGVASRHGQYRVSHHIQDRSVVERAQFWEIQP